MGEQAARQTRLTIQSLCAGGQKCQIQRIRGHGAVLYKLYSQGPGSIVHCCAAVSVPSVVCVSGTMRLWMLAVVAAVAYAGG